jgi:putative tryptophan/tyrosine transport system substrate-binding protein
VRRREFITLLGGAAAAWPLPAQAQQSMPAIGFLSSRAAGESMVDLTGFRRGLAETGFVEGRNITMEYRWAENRYERLPALAADLVARRVAVIAAVGGPVSGLAVKASATAIPFVFISGVDPVKLGLVASLNRPGGNATGVNIFITAVEAKRLGLLHELVPTAASIAIVLNPNSPEYEAQLQDVQSAAQAIPKPVQIIKAGTDGEIAGAFATAVRSGAQALQVCADPFFNSLRERIVALAAQHAVPAIYETRSYATAGGLISYGPDLADMYRQVGNYVGQIIKGAKPADLPVVQPTRLELVVNLKTARVLGIEVPATLLARADEVIE